MSTTAGRRWISVLVIDDDESARARLNEELTRSGFIVSTASCGRLEALDGFESPGPIDAVVLSGANSEHSLEACVALRKAPQGADLPILVAARLDDAEAIEKAYQAGATDFIVIPIQYPALSHRLRYLVRSARIRHDLRETQEQLAAAQRIAKVGHWSWRPDTDTVRLSAEAARILRLQPASIDLGWESFLDGVHDEDRHRIRCALTGLAPSESTFRFEHRLSGPDPDAFVCQEVQASVDAQGLVRITGTIQDITERKQTERRIIRLAYHDEVTGLPNRKFFRDTLDQLLDTPQEATGLAIVAVHLDGLHRVIDTLGHEAGDHLLRMVAERLDHVPEETDTLSPENTLSLDDSQDQAGVLLARVSNQGFMFAFRDAFEPDDIWQRARRIQEILSEPIDVAGHPVVPSACLGLAVYPVHGQSSATLLKNVETAQHEAIANGTGQTVMFAESMHASARERMTIEMALRRATNHYDSLEVYYQPKVDTKSGLPVGMEALLRWNDPILGWVSPGRFISVAEETGLIVPIGSWVLRSACAQTREWRREGFSDLRIAVNISAEQFLRPDFTDTVRQTLAETALPPEALELEITETVLMRDMAIGVRHLTELRATGVHIALDDFGTGYSSLSYLHRFPVDTLKVDRSFISDMMNKPESMTIVRAIILLSHSLNLRVVAEGVEEREQLEQLRMLGCDEIQGFYFSRPLPALQFEAWLRRAYGLHPELAVGH